MSQMYCLKICLTAIISATLISSTTSQDTRCVRATSPDFSITCKGISLPKDNDVLFPMLLAVNPNSDNSRHGFALDNTEIYQNFQPIPRIRFASLDNESAIAVEISLSNITYYNALNRSKIEKLPMGRLLGNMKSAKTLRVSASNVKILSRLDFQGFIHGIRNVDLSGNDITTVNANTLLPIMNASSNFGLKNLDLSRNKIKEFDWDVLLPVASTIQAIQLVENEIGSITFSRATGTNSFPNLRSVQLSNNKITQIALEVLESLLTSNSTVSINLDKNLFCCDCCSFESLVKWAHNPRFLQQVEYLSGTCMYRDGRQTISFSQEWLSRMPLDVFDHCRSDPNAQSKLIPGSITVGVGLLTAVISFVRQV